MADNFNVLFCTKHEDKVSGLYFSWGGIRLEHEHGPAIEEYPKADCFTICGAPCAPTVSVEEAADLYEKVTHCLAKYDNPVDRNASLAKHIRKHGMAEKLGY